MTSRTTQIPTQKPSSWPRWSLIVVWLAWIACALPATTQSEDFPEVSNTQSPQDQPLSPAEALRSLELPDGFQATLFAAEPDVRQPIAVSTDERGRLWVAENYTYAEREVNFDMRLRDRIVILEDRDGDGRSDRRKVFWDQGQKLTSVAVGFGGVWALCAPQLLFIPDRNRDDVPDGAPQVVLDGWNDGPVRHNIVNGLMWGPDGWLYGRHGIQATSRVGRPGTAPSQRVPLNCSIWRYHPTREIFEVVAQGTTNPWGFDYDDHGEMFFINTVIGHLWHVVPGAHFQRMYGADFNPHLYELITQSADHYHWDTGERWNDIRKGVSESTSRFGGGHAHCGLMIYLGDNWPARYRNMLFTVNLHGRRVNNDRLERQGAGYVGTHSADFLRVGDPWFRGIELVYGPDGGVYLADWSDLGECHENDGVHRTSGRIYKITHGSPRPMETLDLSQRDDAELVRFQSHKNDWFVRHARRVLQERAAEGRDMAATHTALFDMYEQQSDVTRRLRAMWCLAATGALSESWLLEQLDDPAEHVRVWAVRLLMDAGEIGRAAAVRLARAAHEDSSGLVRLYLASSLQRVPPELRWEIAAGLVARGEDAQDRQLPLMVWYGIEPAVPVQPRRAVQLASRSRIPLVRRHIARRLTGEIEREPAAVEQLTELLADREQASFRLDILQGMNEALRGWRKAPTPTSWPKLATQLAASSHEDVRAAARELGVVFGDGRALDEVRQLALNGNADVQARRNALRVLVQNRSEDLLPLLRKLVTDRLLSAEAVRGLAAYADAGTPQLILNNYEGLGPAAQEEAVNTLTSRAVYARALLAAVDRGVIDRGDISAYHARQMRSLGDEQIDEDLVRIWGAVREASQEKKQQIAQLKTSLGSGQLDKADLSAGRLLFQKSCANCHTLYGQGSRVGPDLTGSNRHNLDYLLENIVDPSATMNNDFKMSIIALEDGRVATGVVLEKNERTLTLQTQKERIVINRADVGEILPQDLSLMPEGLLNSLDAAQTRDLLAYLSSRTQVPLPDEGR